MAESLSRRLDSRNGASSTLGRCPAGTHQSKKALRIRSNHSLRRRMTARVRRQTCQAPGRTGPSSHETPHHVGAPCFLGLACQVIRGYRRRKIQLRKPRRETPMISLASRAFLVRRFSPKRYPRAAPQCQSCAQSRNLRGSRREHRGLLQCQPAACPRRPRCDRRLSSRQCKN